MRATRNPRWETFKELITTSSLPDIGPTARPDRLSIERIDERLKTFFANAKIPSSLQRHLRATALLWHDYLDESHSISQELRSSEGSLLHGIMHRREPDYPNAKYWFHRVGKHSCYAEITCRVAVLLERRGDQALESRLAPRGQWDPFAFVDVCEEASSQPGAATRLETLKLIQEFEFDALLAHLFVDTPT
jgi:hypothetical protein